MQVIPLGKASGPVGNRTSRRVLHVNKFLYRRGGAEGYMQDVADLQVSAGQTVEFFGMQHDENEPRRYQDYFPPQVDFDRLPDSSIKRVATFGRMLWSRDAEKGMAEVIDQFQPDIVHLHNIYHQLSPSILRPVARAAIPVVMTVHDYKLICPSYQLLDHGRICEACVGRHFHHAPLKRCKDGSFTASMSAAIELAVHTKFGAYEPVTRFVCPSRFLRQKLAQGNVYPDRLRWVPHFVDAAGVAVKQRPGGGVVVAGRLAAEKGVDVVIRAIAAIEPMVALEVAGDGPERDALERLAGVVAPGRVRFHGRLGKADLHRLIRDSAVVAVPSRWYENQPMIVLEAFACGVPVIGTNLGGIPELIDPGVDGELAPADDVAGWVAALESVLGDPQRAFAMGQAARAKVVRDFSSTTHLAALDQVYEEAEVACRTAASHNDGSRGRT
jgi:glycosyltransferase involved in cell wall biosynthesis